jgi:transcriptional regulator with XRE-family HTH domain
MQNIEKNADSLEIARLRRQAGLKQSELAKLTDRSLRTISAWESGERSIKPGIVEYVAEVCRKNAKIASVEGVNTSQKTLPQELKGGSRWDEEAVAHYHKCLDYIISEGTLEQQRLAIGFLIVQSEKIKKEKEKTS